MQNNNIKYTSNVPPSSWRGEGRGRPISPHESMLRKNDSVSSAYKYNNSRRPIPTSGTSVAALQSRWLAAQQEHQQPYNSSSNGSIRSNSSAGSYRSVSPLPIRSRLAFEPGNEESEEEDEDEEANGDQSNQMSQEDDAEEEDDDGQEKDDQEQQQQQLSLDYGYANNGDDLQSDQSSFMSSPSVMNMSTQSTHFGSSQEFKVRKCLFREI